MKVPKRTISNRAGMRPLSEREKYMDDQELRFQQEKEKVARELNSWLINTRYNSSKD